MVQKHDALDWGFTGPMLRASGVAWDLRKAQPYDVYKDLDFETFDDQIKSLKETINSDRKIFKEKEYNYLTHGKFVLDGELKKSA